jgi:hypothetical protein
MLMRIKDGHVLVCPDQLRNGYYFSNVKQRKLEMARLVRALPLLHRLRPITRRRAVALRCSM